MLVGMWMTRDLVTVGPDESLTQVAQLMTQRGIRHLPVVDRSASEERLVGLVSSTDVFHAVPLDVNPFCPGASIAAAPDGRVLRVIDVMHPAPATTTTDAPIESAAAAMHDGKLSALPVVRNGALVGLVTESDILRAFTQLFVGTHVSTRITFDVSDGEDIVPLLASLAGKHRLKLFSLMTLRADDRSYCIVRVAGDSIDALLEDLWQSRHRVESVIRG